MKFDRFCYGHTKTFIEIERENPFGLDFVTKKQVYDKNTTATFDVKAAYKLKTQGYKVKTWGGLYNNRPVFLFDKTPVSRLPFFE